eukprot:278839-Prymnesium_polylepis.2
MLWSVRERVRRARKRKDRIVRTWLSLQGWTTSAPRGGPRGVCWLLPPARAAAAAPPARGGARGRARHATLDMTHVAVRLVRDRVEARAFSSPDATC